MEDSIRSRQLSRRSFISAVAGVTAMSALSTALGPDAADAAVAAKISTLKIPKIGLTRAVYANTQKATLNRGGVGHWAGTAKPATNGNCVLFGHRTSAGGPLRYIHLLAPGDKIRLGGKIYTVTAKEIIRGRETAKMLAYGDNSRPYLSLASCSRSNGLPTSLSYRIVIRARA